MCLAMSAALDRWRGDLAVEAVLIDHAEGRGFCAGGDIRMVAARAKGDGVEARRFFFEEYRMTHELFTYAKPVVSFMDGITVRVGVGISLPPTFRISRCKTNFARSSTVHGLSSPDV